MYKEAVRKQYRFSTTKGVLNMEQLWSLSIDDLDALAVSLDKQYAESGKKSFLVKKSVKDKETKIKLDIVVDILNTKVEELELAVEARETKEHNNKILHLIAEKQDESLKGKSIKQLESMLK